jgi:hypothetical protein
VVFLWVLAAPALMADEPPSFDALMKLDGNAFMIAADQTRHTFYGGQCPYSAEQLIAISEKCSAVVKSMDPDSAGKLWTNPFHAYFVEACKKANDRQLDKLLESYLRLDPNSSEKSATLPPLAGRLLARELASIPQQRLELGGDEPTLPQRLESAPEELKKAWRSFQRAKAPLEEAFPKTTEVIEVYVNMKSFYELIGEALSGATGREDEVRRYGWTGANCMGITDFEDAQDIAMLLMLLREGRMKEAVGAALRAAGTQGTTSSPKDVAKPVIDLLERCGLNWEEIFAGGHLENEARGWEGGRHPYLDALKSYGSERAAGLVKSSTDFAKPEAGPTPPESAPQPIGIPVRFQIFLNGKPLSAGERVRCTIEWNGNFISTTETVAPDGILELSREHFTNPKRPATRVAFHGSGIGADAIVFDTEVSPPWNFVGVTRLDIELSALEITLENREGLNAPSSEKAFVSIERVRADRNEAAAPQDAEETTEDASAPWNFYDEDNEMKVTPTLRLPALQVGKYKVWIAVPGAEIWRGIVVVDKTPQKVSATLKPGSDVQFEVVTPAGLPGPWTQLFKDGKPIAADRDSHTKICHALPLGKYVLKIPGSDPEGKERDGQKIIRGPDEIPFAGREVSFTVEKGSPALIELGEIHLEPLPR